MCISSVCELSKGGDLSISPEPGYRQTYRKDKHRTCQVIDVLCFLYGLHCQLSASAEIRYGEEICTGAVLQDDCLDRKVETFAGGRNSGLFLNIIPVHMIDLI